MISPIMGGQAITNMPPSTQGVSGLPQNNYLGLSYNPQGNYNPQTAFNPMGVSTSTINQSATSPSTSTSKQQYVQNKATSLQNLSGQFANVGGTIYNKQTGQGYSNPGDFANAAGINPNNINWNSLQFDTAWKPQTANPVSQTSQTSTPPPTPAPTGMNGYSGGLGSNTGVYDPYQSPAYQKYIQNAVAAAQPAYDNPTIQAGITAATSGLTAANKIYAQQRQGDLANPNLSEDALTGRGAAELTNLSNLSNAYQQQYNQYSQQQGQAQTAANIPLTAATTEAGYLSGLAKPLTLSSGQTAILPNLAGGGSTTLGSLPSYGAGTNTQTGAPYTFNQNTGELNPMGVGGIQPTNGQLISSSDPFYPTMQQFANDLATGQVSAVPSQYLNGPLAGQLQQMARQINPNFNMNTATGIGNAQQSNTQVAGTAAVNANAAAYAQSVPEVQNLNQALNNVKNLGNMTIDNGNGANINPFSFVPGNTKLADARNLFSSTGQATFDSNITQLQAAIQSLYAQGGGQTPTNITNSINSLANRSISMDGLKSLVSAAEAEGNVLLTSATNKAVSTYQQVMNGSQGVGDNGTSLYNW